MPIDQAALESTLIDLFGDKGTRDIQKGRSILGRQLQLLRDQQHRFALRHLTKNTGKQSQRSRRQKQFRALNAAVIELQLDFDLLCSRMVKRSNQAPGSCSSHFGLGDTRRLQYMWTHDTSFAFAAQ